MDKRFFGKFPNGEDVYIYRLTDGTTTAEIMEYGAAIVSLCPFGDVDVVGGFDTLEAYTQDTSNQGLLLVVQQTELKMLALSLMGKHISLQITITATVCTVVQASGTDFGKVVDYTESSITLSYFSPDGEDGFPSNLSVEVTYTLENHSIIISYKAVRTEPHLFSPAFDGYDHNMILFPKFHKEFNNQQIGLAARVENPKMIMQVYTDQPGLQFYTGNFLGNGPDFKGHIPQIRQGALCLEAQTEPNCINHGEGIYGKGQEYKQLTIYELIAKS